MGRIIEHSVLVPAWDLLRVPARWLSSMVTSKETDPYGTCGYPQNWRHEKSIQPGVAPGSCFLCRDPGVVCNCPGLSSGHLPPSSLYGRSFWPRPVRCCRKWQLQSVIGTSSDKSIVGLCWGGFVPNCSANSKGLAVGNSVYFLPNQALTLSPFCSLSRAWNVRGRQWQMTWQHRFIRGQTKKKHMCLTLFGAITRQPNWNLLKKFKTRGIPSSKAICWFCRIRPGRISLLGHKTRQPLLMWAKPASVFPSWNHPTF